MKALIDMDIVVYRAGFASQKTTWTYKNENFGIKVTKLKATSILKKRGVEVNAEQWEEVLLVDDISFALHLAKQIIYSIINETEASNYKGFLSTTGDTTLFRNEYAVTQGYKANRKDFKKPVHYEAIRNYLLKYYNVEMVSGIEADDALGINQKSDTVICSIDKDLLQIPGCHYNFVKKEWYKIDELSGWKNFYMQVLTGDNADNIPGIHGLGPAKASYILRECKTKIEMYERCLKAYELYSGKENTEEYLLEQCNLLYIQRKKDDRFKRPK